jgi:hypothetical protein
MDELIALRERVARLEDANAALMRQLDELRALADSLPRRRSIRDSRRCPACDGRVFLHVPRATQATDSGAVDFGLTHELRWTGTVVRGAMATFTCCECGLVEFHAGNLEDVKIDGKTVIAIEPEPDPPRNGPFR